MLQYTSVFQFINELVESANFTEISFSSRAKTAVAHVAANKPLQTAHSHKRRGSKRCTQTRASAHAFEGQLWAARNKGGASAGRRGGSISLMSAVRLEAHR
jgi:hypothetical protein